MATRIAVLGTGRMGSAAIGLAVGPLFNAGG
jgi:hypothetical protein